MIQRESTNKQLIKSPDTSLVLKQSMHAKASLRKVFYSNQIKQKASTHMWMHHLPMIGTRHGVRNLPLLCRELDISSSMRIVTSYGHQNFKHKLRSPASKANTSHYLNPCAI